MNSPTVIPTFRDTNSNFVFHVRAYRAPTRDELLENLASYLRGARKAGSLKHLKGKTVTLLSLLGATDRVPLSVW